MNLVGAPVAQQPEQLCALTESLSGAIRWRFLDYGQLLTKQLKLLAGPEFALRQTDVARTGRGLGGWKQ